MPIKGNNIISPARTKTIYINWDEREVYSQEAYEECRNSALTEMLEDESILGEWILDNFSYHEVGRIALNMCMRSLKSTAVSVFRLMKRASGKK